MEAESTLMISMGQRLASAAQAALLPDAVGPVRQKMGACFMKMGSLPSKEKAVQVSQRPLCPGRASVVAVIGPLGLFHVTQQGVHLVQCEVPVGAHRTVTGHGGKQGIMLLCDLWCVARAGKIIHHLVNQ